MADIIPDPEEQTRRDRAQALAIAQAVRDALVDRTLHDHAAHLEEINGSQREMANALSELQSLVERQTVSNETVAKYVADQKGSQLSRKTIWIGVLTLVAAYGTMIGTLLVSLPK